jgi:hypothetical protein
MAIPGAKFAPGMAARARELLFPYSGGYHDTRRCFLSGPLPGRSPRSASALRAFALGLIFGYNFDGI